MNQVSLNLSSHKNRPWGVMWNSYTKQTIHLFEENEHFFTFDIVNEQITITKFNVYGPKNVERLLSKPAFLLKRIKVNNKFQVYFQTIKEIDPKIVGYGHCHPGSILLDVNSSQFTLEGFYYQIIIFKSKNNLPPGVKETMMIIGEIGKGSFGQAYSVFSLISQKVVAIKTVNLEISRKERFRKMEILENEKVGLLRLSHPNIVSALEVESKLSPFCLCIELADHGDLQSFINRCDISLQCTKEIFRQVLKGVQYLHCNNLIHRDIKPSNLLVFSEARQYKVKLADFGSLCRSFNDPYIFERHGTSLFMPPEVSRSIIWKLPVFYFKQTDIFSVGATFYFVVMKSIPYESLYSSEDFRKRLLLGLWTQQDYNLPMMNLCQELKHFLSSCLNVNNLERPSALQLLNHPFLK